MSVSVRCILSLRNGSRIFAEVLHNSTLRTKKKGEREKKESGRVEKEEERREPLISKVARGDH